MKSTLAQEFTPGVVLDDRYEILEKIGSGGMGAVFAAKRLALGDLVAIKQLHSGFDTAENRSRLLIEARAAAHIRHPNVVKIFDFGSRSGSNAYLVMEHLEGLDLGQMLSDQGRLPLERALEILAPVCSAVEAGHRRGIIHRDIKPSNILIAKSDDGREVIKVLDFGLALFDSEPAPAPAATDSLIGTPQYMAPEFVHGDPASPATDVYSLGILLYQMVTGELPFEGRTPVQILMAVAQGQRRPATQVVPELPSDLVAVIDRALDAQPGRRPTSPEQLARLAERTLRASSPTPAPVMAKAPRQPTATPQLECFVGRAGERAHLLQEYQRALGGEGRLVMVIGEPGIGKTRLLERVAEDIVSQEQAVVVWGRFFDSRDGQAAAYKTFRDMLQGSLSSPASRPSSNPSALATPSGNQSAPALALDLEGEGDAWRLHTEIVDAFAALAGSHPLVIMLDDLQWAGRADLELLEHLHQSLAQRGTLLLATVRHSPPDSELKRWQQTMARRRASVELEVSSFGIDDVDEYLNRAFGSLHIHPRDLRRLHRASSGNPYFLSEMLRNLLANGTLSNEAGCNQAGSNQAGSNQASNQASWRCGTLDTLDLPATLTHLIEAHLSELDNNLRRVLQVAAVIGESFRFEVLSTAAQVEEDSLDELLEKAVVEGLLRDDSSPTSSDFSFASEAVRKVLYDTTSRSRRRRIHAQVVEALHRHHGHDLSSIGLTLAFHHAAIGQWPEAFACGLDAGQRALARFDSDAAESALKLARAAADNLTIPLSDETEVSLGLATGILERRLGQLESAKTHLLKAFGLVTDRQQGHQIGLELARCRLALGDLESALELARKVTLDANSKTQLPTLLKAGMCEASVLLRLGRASEAAVRLDEVMALAGEQAPLPLRSRILRERAWADLTRGAFAEAETRAQQSFELARAAGDLPAQHHALSALAAIRSENGDSEEALLFHRRALELARRLSLRRREGIDLANIGEAYFRMGELDQALEHFTLALAIFVEIGDRACEGDCGVNIGRTMLARGDLEPALEALIKARRLCEKTGRTEYAGIARLYEGDAWLEKSHLSEARHSYDEALELFAAQASHMQWKAELGIAHISKLTEDFAAARQHAQNAKAQLEAQLASQAAGVDTHRLDSALLKAGGLLEELSAEQSRRPSRQSQDTLPKGDLD